MLRRLLENLIVKKHMDLFKKRKKKQPRTLHFLIAIADRPLDETEFKAKEGLTVFFSHGEIEKHDIIPRTTLKMMVEKFMTKAPEGVTVTESVAPETPV